MRRLVWLLLVLVVAFVVAERVPAIRARLPWLPTIPGLTQVADQDAAGRNADGDEDASGRRDGGKRGGDRPVPVLVGTAETADVPITAEVLGTVQATNTVTVKSQVDGKLIALEFQDGQDVVAGDVLARVDPATFQAAYDQAVAKKAQDEAILANSQSDLVRYAKLAATQYGSAQQADTQKALVAQNKATLQQDQALVDSARTTLDYATIRAPISGRTGIRLVDAGNIVHASDATGIVTIAEVKPIAAVFNLPQQLLGQINAAVAKGPLKLEAFSPDTHGLIDTGRLQVVDNTVDQTTGTVRLKGTFPNAGLQLWPGQFVNLKLTIGVEHEVVVVPTPAIQRGPNGTYVFVVNPDDTVRMQKVTVGRQTEDRSVVTDGLMPPARVVTTGFSKLIDGARITVAPAANGTDAGKPADTPASPATDRPKASDDNAPARHRRREGAT